MPRYTARRETLPCHPNLPTCTAPAFPATEAVLGRRFHSPSTSFSVPLRLPLYPEPQEPHPHGSPWGLQGGGVSRGGLLTENVDIRLPTPPQP